MRRWTIALYEICLRLYPRDFRARFGAELADAFTEAIDDARRSGRAATWRAAGAGYRDLIRHSLGERWLRWRRRPSGLSPSAPAVRPSIGGFSMSAFFQDLRFALRTLRATPGFTLAVIATIALGVGATTSIWAAVDRIVLRPLPFPDSSRAVMLCETHPKLEGYCVASPPNVADWAASVPSLEAAGVARNETFIASLDGAQVGVRGGLATGGFFDVLGLRAALGRVLSDQDLNRGRNNVAVVSDRFWRDRLKSDPSVIGRSITFDGRSTTIVGVLPADPYIPTYDFVDVWKPITAGIDNPDVRKWRGFMPVGRLKKGATLSQLNGELEVVRARLTAAYPSDNAGYGVRVVTMRDHVTGGDRRMLWIFLGAVALVMTIACANVAGLLLVRATTRAPEFAVRASLGAGTGRLIRQMLTESLALAAAGGALGVLLAVYATRLLVSQAPKNIPRLDEVAIDARVALFSVALTTFAAIAFGLAPARAAAKARLAGALGSTRHTPTGLHRARVVLVCGELSIAVVLLVSAGLLTRAFARLSMWDPGFDRSGLTISFMLVPPATFKTATSAVDALERAREAAASVPGVTRVGLGSGGPLFGGTETGELKGTGMTVNWLDVDPHYFSAMGRRIVRGRDIAATDVDGGPLVAVVNETFARRAFPGADPIGRRVTVQDVTADIVGVVADVTPFRPDAASPPEVFWPIRQYKRFAAYLVMRLAPDVSGTEAAVRARIAGIDPGIQVTPFVPLERIVTGSLIGPRFNMTLIGFFAMVAVTLAAVGVYGIMASTVASRTRELGIRLALGATPGRLMGEVLLATARLGAIGGAIGIVGALGAGRGMQSLLYGLPATDALTFVGTVLLLVAVTIAAALVPARRAGRVDPLVALRTD